MTSRPGAGLRVPGILVLLVAGLAASGCGAISDLRGPHWSGRVDSTAGVAIVRNPSTPVLAAGSATLAPLWRDTLPDSVVAGPAWEPGPSLAVSGGRAYLLDRRAGRVRVYDASTGAARGGWPTSAPGGRDSLVAIVALPGRVVVGSHQELAVYPADGHDVHRIRLRASGRSLMPLDDTTVLSMEAGGAGVAWQRYPVDDTVGTAFLPADVRSRIAPDVMDEDCWKMDGGGGRLLVLACTRPVILVVGASGVMTAEIGIERSADTASEAQLDTLGKLVRARAAAMGSKLSGSVLDGFVKVEALRQRVEHAYRGVRFDSASGLYAILRQTPAFLGGGGAARFDLLTRGGVYLASTSLPARVAAYDVADGRLYALLEPSGASPCELVAYRIDVPSDARERSAWWKAPGAGPDAGIRPEKNEGGR